MDRGSGNGSLRQKSGHKAVPATVLCDLASAVLNGDTNEMLEYSHLITQPKYKEVCGDAYGKEVDRLAQGIP